MYCSKHQTSNADCGCTMEAIKKYEGEQIRLSELDIMEAELEMPPAGRMDFETHEMEIQSLRKVVLDLIRLIRKELY